MPFTFINKYLYANFNDVCVTKKICSSLTRLEFQQKPNCFLDKTSISDAPTCLRF